MLYGILNSSTNTGLDSELAAVFSTPLNINSNQPSYVQDSMNLRRIGSSQNVQRWEIEANLTPTLGDPSLFVNNIIAGHSEKIYVRMPQLYGVQLTNSTNVTVAGTYGAGINELQILNITKLNKGEFFQFSNDTKVYVVTETNTVAGNTMLKFFPKLRKAVSVATGLVLGGKVTLHAFYDTSVKLGITYIDGVLSDPGSVRLVEAL